jgi:deoxyribodipyrimidine photo-lyase
LERLAPAEELSDLGLADWSLERIGFEPADCAVEPGEQAASRQFEAFLERIDRYGELRDYPALGAVSNLSPHFRFGTLSVRKAARAAMACGTEGARKWLMELIWREFYQAILWRFPHVVQHAFRPEFDGVQWPGGDEEFAAWCDGRTGYPIVDAAMRCLRQTGQMHNRLRMVAASFLAKDLLVDWRRGEAWFARWLLDFELASNNGGWQWAASTGCDAQPYFRIFNPVLQSRKFDPQGAFLRRWCQELAGFSDERIHTPWEASELEQRSAGCIIGRDYPAPIVDHATQKARAVALLSSYGSPKG